MDTNLAAGEDNTLTPSVKADSRAGTFSKNAMPRYNILDFSGPGTAPPNFSGVAGNRSSAVSPSDYNDEATFISNVDSSGLVAGTSFGTWSYADRTSPATYSATNSWATKQGPLTPGSAGGTVYYYFDPSSSWTNTEKAGLISGLALWSSEVNISFQTTTDSTQANLTFYRGVGTGSAYEYFPNESPASVGSSSEGSPGTGAYILIDTSVYGFGDIGGPFSYAGGYSYETLVHEEGHFLGLGHGGPYNGSVNSGTEQFSAYDTRLWDLMSYIEPSDTGARYYSTYPVSGTSWSGNDPTTPMIVDIAAAQRLYGAATTGELTQAQTFGFNTTLAGAEKNYFDFTVNQTPVVTIWDSASGNTLDLSGFTQDAAINLNPDSFCSCGGLVNNIGIADGTKINNAVGGGGDDLFVLNPNLIGTYTGDGGADTFSSILVGINDDRISDFASDDRIRLTDADLTSLSFGYDPTTGILTLSQGQQTTASVNLPTGLGAFSKAADPSGGIDLTVSPIAPPPAALAVTISSVSGAPNSVAHTVAGTVDTTAAPQAVGGTVTVSDAGTALGSTAIGSDGSWSLATTFRGDGPSHAYQLTAAASDASGDAGTSSPFTYGLDFTPNRPAFGTVTNDSTTAEGQVYALYDGILSRTPDIYGWEAYLPAVTAGESTHALAQTILASAEYTQRYGAVTQTDNSTFVTDLYQSALGRSPDPNGFAYWEQQLAAGESRADVAVGFATSQENEQQLAPAFAAGVFAPDASDAAIARLYDGLLGRDGDGYGLSYWESTAQGGGSLANVAQGFLGSAEYATQNPTPPSNGGYVNSLYEGALGRSTAGDPSSDYWTQALGSGGLSRADVAVGICTSTEAIGHLQGKVELGFHLT